MRPFHPVVQEALDAGVTVKVGWRRNDPVQEAEAVDLWRRLNGLPRGVTPEKRIKEIIATAYVDGRMAGVATAVVEEVSIVRQKFAMWRCAVTPEHRRNHVMRALGGWSLGILEDWYRDRPQERVMGMGTIAENDSLRVARMPAVIPSAALMMIGYTPLGERIRISWFDHARV